MKRLILALLAVLLIAAPVSAQSPAPSTWDEFQAERDSYGLWVGEWSAELSTISAPDQLPLMWADLLARSLDHLATAQGTLWDECYKDYALAYTRFMSWTVNYIAGVYLVRTASDIEPPSDITAETIITVAQVYSAGATKALEGVTCNDASVPATPTPLA